MTRSRARIAVTALFLAAAVAAWAGTAYRVKCETPECRAGWSIALGGGSSFHQATGYCQSCAQFVSIKWSHKSRSPATWRYWDPKSGETVSLYACPTCQGLFLPIREIEDLRHCPKCRKPSLTSQQYLVYD